MGGSWVLRSAQGRSGVHGQCRLPSPLLVGGRGRAGAAARGHATAARRDSRGHAATGRLVPGDEGDAVDACAGQYDLLARWLRRTLGHMLAQMGKLIAETAPNVPTQANKWQSSADLGEVGKDTSHEGCSNVADSLLERAYKPCAPQLAAARGIHNHAAVRTHPLHKESKQSVLLTSVGNRRWFGRPQHIERHGLNRFRNRVRLVDVRQNHRICHCLGGLWTIVASCASY